MRKNSVKIEIVLDPHKIYNQNYNTCTPTDSNKGVYHSEVISAFQRII